MSHRCADIGFILQLYLSSLDPLATKGEYSISLFSILCQFFNLVQAVKRPYSFRRNESFPEREPRTETNTRQTFLMLFFVARFRPENVYFAMGRAARRVFPFASTYSQLSEIAKPEAIKTVLSITRSFAVSVASKRLSKARPTPLYLHTVHRTREYFELSLRPAIIREQLPLPAGVRGRDKS